MRNLPQHTTESCSRGKANDLVGADVLAGMCEIRQEDSHPLMFVSLLELINKLVSERVSRSVCHLRFDSRDQVFEVQGHVSNNLHQQTSSRQAMDWASKWVRGPSYTSLSCGRFRMSLKTCKLSPRCSSSSEEGVHVREGRYRRVRTGRYGTRSSSSDRAATRPEPILSTVARDIDDEPVRTP